MSIHFNNYVVQAQAHLCKVIESYSSTATKFSNIIWITTNVNVNENRDNSLR